MARRRSDSTAYGLGGRILQPTKLFYLLWRPISTALSMRSPDGKITRLGGSIPPHEPFSAGGCDTPPMPFLYWQVYYTAYILSQLAGVSRHQRGFSAGGRISPPGPFQSWRAYCTAGAFSQLAGVSDRLNLSAAGWCIAPPAHFISWQVHHTASGLFLLAGVLHRWRLFFSAGGRIRPPAPFLGWLVYRTASAFSQLAGASHRQRLVSAGGRITPPTWFLSWRVYLTARAFSELAGVSHRQRIFSQLAGALHHQRLVSASGCIAPLAPFLSWQMHHTACAFSQLVDVSRRLHLLSWRMYCTAGVVSRLAGRTITAISQAVESPHQYLILTGGSILPQELFDYTRMGTIISLVRACLGRHSAHAPLAPLPPAPLPRYPTPLFIYIVSLEDAELHLATIPDGAVIGFDLESVEILGRPKLSKAEKRVKLATERREILTFVINWNNVDICLAQIATDGGTFVINLRAIRALPIEFIRICESPNIVKVAAGIFSDGQRLWDSFRLNLRSAASLGLVARLAYPLDLHLGKPYGQEPGLLLIVRHALSFDLPKTLQQSEWDSENLSDAQKEYAAADVHATLQAFRAMHSVIQARGFPVEENWYMFDVIERERFKQGTQTGWKAQC
ncbi:ribonuclease H-like domain-containing protein [Mycena albidolilacea]|uniref:Ribonuclease H-like domain-containing protein n=1 Tax=Mycena albidolilacea TaxID=1033008 RepID=A0AAD7F354_9AGAR|nr:ribonuclease H-like domain-containing protein [Mycena albidolilacea]